jgi:hypothetical protein
MRDDFTEDVKRTLAKRVAMRCSQPDCRAITSGPQLDEAKAMSVGVAAHITAASPGGPRYDASLTSEERKSARNGIWLCQNCAKKVDDDEQRYSAELLRAWKLIAEDAAFSGIGKANGLAATSLQIELPEPVNPISYRSAGGSFTSTWRFKIRLIARGLPLNILQLRLSEAGVGDWQIEEVFRESDGRPLIFPIAVERAVEFWISAASPQNDSVRRSSVGKVTVHIRDHTQASGEGHELVIDNPPIR